MPLALRPSPDPPPTPDPVPHPARVSIRHPAYDSPNTLLELDAVDTDEQGRHGVLFAMAHTSAAIVANNEFQGWLSTTKKGDLGRVQLAAGDLLAPGDYYFHVSNSGEASAAPDAPDLSPYPVVPNFRQWRFPSQLPDFWMQAVIGASRFPQDVRARDESCLITRHRLVTSVAHVIPAVESEWFSTNEMYRFRTYTPEGQPVIDKAENLILLRQDLHFAWDRADYSLLPKQDGDGIWKWALHAHTFSVDELHTLYHNRILHSVRGVSRHFLFARFAWDIFPRLRTFLSAGVGRRIKTSQGVHDFTAEETRSLCEGQGRNRSLSPKKSGSPSKRMRQNAEDVGVDTQSFDSGIDIPDKVPNFEPHVDDLDHGTEYSGEHEKDVTGRRIQHEWGQWRKSKGIFNASLDDASQRDLEEWKLRKGLPSSWHRRRQSCAYEETEDIEEDGRGRKRFRGFDAG